MQTRHQAATLGILVLLCLFGVFFGVRAVLAPLPDEILVSDDEPACEPREVKAGTKVGPQEVTVSVYNASGRAGRASQTLQALIERGYAPGTSGNIKAPKVKWVQVWTDTENNPGALLVARQFGEDGARIRVRDDLPGIGVVVVVGPGMEDLGADSPDSVKAKQDGSFCSPPVT